MRVGTSINSTYPGVDARVGAHRMIERAQAARDAGLDSLFIGDHHNVPVPYFQNSPMLGRLLGEWKGRLAGALYLLPLWNPVLLAEQIGTLAAIHDGPFAVQIALGGGSEQFAALGASLRTRPSRFEASLEIIRALLAGESVTTDAPFHIPAAQIAPVPPEPVEFWIGAAAPPAVDRAARMGDAFIAGPESTPTRAATILAEYQEACVRHGREARRIVVRRDVFVGEDEAHAQRIAGPVIEGGYRGFDPDALVIGGPERVTEQLADLESMGYTDVLVRHLVADQSEVLGSFERLGRVAAALR